VRVKRRATRDKNRVNDIAASILEQTPILVRADGARFVLIEGLHRLEAAKALRLLSVYLSTRESTGADARWFCLPRSAQINT
jgi:ParB-like chromosome segregation protein Spo0J